VSRPYSRILRRSRTLAGVANGEVEHDFEAVERALSERDPPSGR